MAITRIGNPAIADQRGVDFRNIIINGDMSIAQRGTSFSCSNSSGSIYTLDRFQYIDVDTPDSVYTITQDTDVPSGQGFAKSLKVDVATADSSLDADDGTQIEHRVEGQNLQYLNFGNSSAKSLTLSFWVKSNKTGTYVVRLTQPDASSRMVSFAYTISSASTWEKKIIEIPADTGGTINNDNGAGLNITWWLSAGTSYTSGSLASTWQSYANGDSAVGQVNLADSTSNEWYITGVQLETGQVASDFEFLPVDVNLDRCYRYYQNLPYAFDTPICNANAWSSTTAYGVMHLFSTMRTRPSLDQVTGTGYYRFYNTGDSNDLFDSFTIQSEGNGNVVRLQNTDSISATAGDGGWFVMVNGSSYLAFDAEL